MTSEPFEIWLVWSDRTLMVPAGVPALKVLRDAGVLIDEGCAHGSCGTCVTEYVEGDVIHKDTCLSEADRDHEFCPCVSRAKGRLVLAL